MLYIVGTPIGNLADITLRALDALKSVDLIAAEDTRHSLRLLQRYEIRKPLVSFHEHNEARRTEELVVRLREGANIALITDAGLPAISDPGARLVRACADAGIPYTVLPGPSAVLTALVGSGLCKDGFFYGGFLPVKSGQRERELQTAVDREQPSVYFESPHRLEKTLDVLSRLAPERPLCVARELTKQFEEYRRGPAPLLRDHYAAHPPKGEITLVISGAERKPRHAAEAVSYPMPPTDR